IQQSDDLSSVFYKLPGLSFYRNAKQRLDNNVEFDKTKFAAYFDSVVMTKLLLLHETEFALGAGGGATDPSLGQLSQLTRDQLTALGKPGAASYDFTLLNLLGDHGGNVLTATVPKPGFKVDDFYVGDGPQPRLLD